MALRPCRECGAQVSTAAKACPRCGIKLPGIASWWERKHPVLSTALFLFVVAGAATSPTFPYLPYLLGRLGVSPGRRPGHPEPGRARTKTSRAKRVG
jgi:hypothetical protein